MSSTGWSLALALWIGLSGALAAADPPAVPAKAPDAAPTKGANVGLDALLRLPPSAPVTEQPRSGGASRQEWEQRFATARGDVKAAETALEKAQHELDRAASGSNTWQMSAPGQQASTETGPVSFKLRQEIRRQQDELAAAQKRLNELEVEAKLAGVPDEWIGGGITSRD